MLLAVRTKARAGPRAITSHNYRITRKKAHPVDNNLAFENIITGCAVAGGCGISPVMAIMHGSPAARGCGIEGVC